LQPLVGKDENRTTNRCKVDYFSGARFVLVIPKARIKIATQSGSGATVFSKSQFFSLLQLVECSRPEWLLRASLRFVATGMKEARWFCPDPCRDGADSTPFA
jgi:hypothetical protein